jgi:YgiT-type zinc finger domain-containing protein
MSERPSYTCPRCQIGQCHPGELTYVRMYQGLLFSVPAMPAWTCDICGLQEFDQEVLMHIDRLMGQGVLPPRAASVKKPPVDKPAEGRKASRIKT